MAKASRAQKVHVGSKARLGSGARFKSLTTSLKKKGAKNPSALAAWIGRKKFGAKKMASMSAKGRRNA